MTNMKKYWYKFSKDLIKDLDDNNILITGPAGVGKSTFLKYFREYCLSNNIKVALTAMTGVAAINIQGETIHRFLNMGIKNNMSQFSNSYFKDTGWKKVKSNMAKTDIIVLDEVSMLRSDSLELIDQLLRMATGIEEVFGGKRLLFVGDFFQLAPIVRREDNVKYPYAFQSKVWLDAKIKTILLEKVHRQKNKKFIDTLHKIRMNQFDDEAQNMINEIAKKEIPDDAVKFVSTNRKAEEYNLNSIKELKGEPVIYYSTAWAETPSLKKDIVNGSIAEDELTLKMGARVMILVNDDMGRYWNGSLGKVVYLGSDSVSVVLDTGGKRVNLKPNTWSTIDKEGEVTATFEQIPVKLAYAVTIHKSQGLTFDRAVVDCANIFTYGQLYVALSRVKTPEGLYLLGFNKNHIKVNKNVKLFYEWAKKNS